MPALKSVVRLLLRRHIGKLCRGPCPLLGYSRRIAGNPASHPKDLYIQGHDPRSYCLFLEEQGWVEVWIFFVFWQLSSYHRTEPVTIVTYDEICLAAIGPQLLVYATC